MLRSVKPSTLARLGRSIKPTNVQAVVVSIRHNSTVPKEPKEVFTKINDSSDPQRNAFFQYTWGSWLKNDKLERQKRETKFNIEGLASLFGELSKINSSDTLKAPKLLDDGTTVLENNVGLLGGSSGVKSIASIHEGKHNRIYQITLENDRKFVLRIPYYLEQAYTTSLVVKSEVATLDFLNLKLKASVPKVIAYGYDRENFLKSPFILMEYFSGDLLMRNWDPLDSSEGAESKLKEIIDPVMDFYAKLLEVTFNKYGSLYFYSDVTPEEQKDLPYDGETNQELSNRWRIGPTTERIYHKGKFRMSKNSLLPHLGPFKDVKDVLKSVGNVQIDFLKHRIGLSAADAGESVSKEELEKQIAAFEDYLKVAPLLLNLNSLAIANVEDAFKPRLFFPDLDPLNVIVTKDGPVFVDFENTLIKPFILQSYPAFVAYNGAKIYNLEEDINDYELLDDLQKQQFQFMYYKTRNERLWELALNAKRHDLISIASPHVKILKQPYTQMLELKSDQDYLYLVNALIQLQPMWEAYVANNLVDTSDSKYPIEFDQERLEYHENAMEDHQRDIVSTPFAATGGWVPQDMFEQLKLQGIIVSDGNGNFKIETDKVLERTEEENARAAEAEAEALNVVDNAQREK